MSRLDEVVKQIEQGEPVDWGRLSLLQSLDLALIGEQFAASAAQRERDADDQLAELLGIAPQGATLRSLPTGG